MSKSDTTPRFTEADLRAAHEDGWKQGRACSVHYKGGYSASFWDRSELRNELGLTPPGSEFYRAHKVKHRPQPATTLPPRIANRVSPEAVELALATQDAHSFTNFGQDQWEGCAAILLTYHDLTVEEAEAVLRSKHMRWCYDTCRDPSHATAEEFENYLAGGRNMERSTWKKEAQTLY